MLLSTLCAYGVVTVGPVWARDSLILQRSEVCPKSHPPKSLVHFFRESPLVGVGLDLERDHDA